MNKRLGFDEVCTHIFNAKPDAFHYYGRKAKSYIEQARNCFAENLNVYFSELYFSGNSLQQSISLIQVLLLFSDVKDIYLNPFEQNDFLEYLNIFAEKEKLNLHFLNVDKQGVFDLKELQALLSKQQSKSLLYLSHATEYSGILIPVKEIKKICETTGTLFFLNLKSTIGKYEIKLNTLLPDFASIDLSEHNGCLNTGVFFMKQSVQLSDFSFHRIKKHLKINETKDVHLICQLSESFKYLYSNIDLYAAHIHSIQDYFIRQFGKYLGLKHVSASYHKKGIYSYLSYFFPEKKFGKYLAEKLDMQNIVCEKISYPFNEEAGTYIRFSFGKDNSEKDVDYLIQILKSLGK